MAVGSENCGKCGEPVTGKAMKIKERAYHEEKCFSCVECMKDLKAVPVYSREEKLYCERDYREKFVPKCGQCKDYVLDVSILLLDFRSDRHIKVILFQTNDITKLIFIELCPGDGKNMASRAFFLLQV